MPSRCGARLPFFPAGTVHIAVVDPGVGTGRKAMAARLGESIMSDLTTGCSPRSSRTPAAQEKRQALLRLTSRDYWLQNVSHTFHGRDIFAPVGAHLANGVPLEKLGTPFTDPVLLPLTKPLKTAEGFVAHISVVDAFGNLTTDLPAVEIAGKSVKVMIKDRVINGLSTSYGHHHPGDVITLVDSENYLEVAVVNGSAAEVLGAQVGDEVKVLFVEYE